MEMAMAADDISLAALGILEDEIPFLLEDAPKGDRVALLEKRLTVAIQNGLLPTPNIPGITKRFATLEAELVALRRRVAALEAAHGNGNGGRG